MNRYMVVGVARLRCGWFGSMLVVGLVAVASAGAGIGCSANKTSPPSQPPLAGAMAAGNTGGGGNAGNASGGANGAGSATIDVSAACVRDADCKVEADYCTGCLCRSLGPGEKVPPCAGPGVRCLADPCLNKQGVCVNGHCGVGERPRAGAYDPCAGKPCGDLCHLCRPADTDCAETAVVKQCNAGGVCSAGDPGCRAR